jgi:hypothetical protein
MEGYKTTDQRPATVVTSIITSNGIGITIQQSKASAELGHNSKIQKPLFGFAHNLETTREATNFQIGMLQVTSHAVFESVFKPWQFYNLAASCASSQTHSFHVLSHPTQAKSACKSQQPVDTFVAVL